MCNEKVRSGRCAAGKQTTCPDKREVVSHVRTRSLDRSSPRVARRKNCPSLVNDRVSSVMKNLEDYLPARSREKMPVKPSECPIYSPDTLSALENAEKLIKEAQKKILEVSYDVDSSPEREKSIGPDENGKADDDDALYIRDIVAMRFHEANESGRIFTRPTARRPIERFCRPEMRSRRVRGIGERNDKICCEESTISRLLEMENKLGKINRGQSRGMGRNSILPKQQNFVEEVQTRISRQNETTSKNDEKCASPRKKDGRTSFRVQEGPHVDIRNELTITNIEKVDISPRPRSSLPVQQNIKTFEFRHESQVDKISEREKQEPEVCQVTPDEPEVEKISSEREEKSNRADVTPSPRTRSQPDLVENKLGRSIQPESLEGHANASISHHDEHVTNEKRINRGESFIDFLRQAGNDENCRENLIFDALESRDKINIFDRAVEQFLDEFQACERERDKNRAENPEMDCPDGEFVGDGAAVEKLENSQENGFFDDINYSEENWDPEEINLEAPNFGEFDNVLTKFNGRINKVVRGMKSLGAVMSEYSIDERVSNRSKGDPENLDRTSIDPEFLPQLSPQMSVVVPTRDISSGLESDKIEAYAREKIPSKNTEIKSTIDMEKSASSDGIFTRISMHSGCEDSNNELPLKKVSTKFNSHLRFSTPLNNVLKIGGSSNKNADCNLREFASFLDGIQRPKINVRPLQRKQDALKIDKSNDDNIERNKLASALTESRKTYLQREKKMVLDEIEKKCNLNSLFNREQSSQIGNDETRDTITFPTYSNRKKREQIELRSSRTTSLIQDSAIGRETEDFEKISIGTNIIDEYATKKDSSKSEQSAAMRNPEISQTQCMQSEISEITGTKTAIMARNSIQHESTEIELEAKSSPLRQPETIIRTNLVSQEESKKNDSAKEEEMKNKNLALNSPGSSLKDRTSFDISTVYSEDFENPTGSSDKSKAPNKTDSDKNLPLKLNVTQVEVPMRNESRNSKNDEDKNERATSSESSKAEVMNNESKVEIDYLEKSISISVINSEEKEGDKKLNDDKISIDHEVIEEKKAGEKSLDKEEANSSETLKNSGKDSNSAGFSTKSSKSLGTSSPAEESRPDRLKPPEIPVLATNLIASSCLLCEVFIGPCNCKECAICIETRNVVEETITDHIKTVFEDVLDNGEEKLIQSCISEQEIKTLESRNLGKITKSKDSRVDEILSESEIGFGEQNVSQKSECLQPKERETKVQFPENNVSRMKECLKPEMQKLEVDCHRKNMSEKVECSNPEVPEFSQIVGSERPSYEINKSYRSCTSKFDEIVKFESSLMIHSTPKKFIDDSTCASKKFVVPDPDPISTDDHASRATDTCSENYSEGELYLPSSCSYSLGEIRISELGTCATSGACVDSSSRNADGVRIFFTKTFANLDSSNNTINALNSLVQSLGEVQETDVESTDSSQRITSDGEHRGKL